MKHNIGRYAWRLALALAVSVTGLATLAGCTLWRLGEARALARASTAFQQEPPAPELRLLVVGDSTGVGTGASQPVASVAGLLGAAYPHLLVHNQASDGARFDAVPAQLAATAEGQGYDVVLIQAGGNDVIRGTDAAVLAEVLEVSIGAAKAQLRPGGVAIVQPAGNVGNAAFFLPPLSHAADEPTRTRTTQRGAQRRCSPRRGVREPVPGSRAGPLCAAPRIARVGWPAPQRCRLPHLARRAVGADRPGNAIGTGTMTPPASADGGLAGERG